MKNKEKEKRKLRFDFWWQLNTWRIPFKWNKVILIMFRINQLQLVCFSQSLVRFPLYFCKNVFLIQSYCFFLFPTVSTLPNCYFSFSSSSSSGGGGGTSSFSSASTILKSTFQIPGGGGGTSSSSSKTDF